jgi:hypothetical protein
VQPVAVLSRRGHAGAAFRGIESATVDDRSALQALMAMRSSKEVQP